MTKTVAEWDARTEEMWERGIRPRLQIAVEALDVPRPEVELIMSERDPEVREAELLRFANRHALSLDWLIGGEELPLLRTMLTVKGHALREPVSAAANAAELLMVLASEPSALSFVMGAVVECLDEAGKAALETACCLTAQAIAASRTPAAA